MFTSRIRILVSCLIYIIRSNGPLLLSLCNVATIPRKARLLNWGCVMNLSLLRVLLEPLGLILRRLAPCRVVLWLMPLVLFDFVLVGSIAHANIGRSDGDLVLGLQFNFLFGKARANFAIVYIVLVGILAIALNPVLPHICIRLIPLDYVGLVAPCADDDMTLPVPNTLLAISSYAT